MLSCPMMFRSLVQWVCVLCNLPFHLVFGFTDEEALGVLVYDGLGAGVQHHVVVVLVLHLHRDSDQQQIQLGKAEPAQGCQIYRYCCYGVKTASL